MENNNICWECGQSTTCDDDLFKTIIRLRRVTADLRMCGLIMDAEGRKMVIKETDDILSFIEDIKCRYEWGDDEKLK